MGGQGIQLNNFLLLAIAGGCMIQFLGQMAKVKSHFKDVCWRRFGYAGWLLSSACEVCCLTTGWLRLRAAKVLPTT